MASLEMLMRNVRSEGMKGKLIFAWLTLGLGSLLMFSHSGGHIAASLILFAVAFVMGAIIAASGKLFAGMAILALSILLPIALGTARLM